MRWPSRPPPRKRKARTEKSKAGARLSRRASVLDFTQHQLKVKSTLAEPLLVVTVKTAGRPACRTGVVAMSLPSPLTVNCAAEPPNFTDCVLVNPEPVIVTGVGVA